MLKQQSLIILILFGALLGVGAFLFLGRPTIDSSILLFGTVLVTVIWVSRTRPLMMLQVTLVYLAIEGAMKILSRYHPVIHVGADLLVIVLMLYWLTSKTVGQEEIKFGITWIEGLVLVFAGWCICMVFHPYSYSLLASLAALKTHITMVPLFFLALAGVETKRDIRILVNTMLIIVVAVCAIGSFEFGFFHDDLVNLNPVYQDKSEKAVWVDQSGERHSRPFSTTNNPGGAVSWGKLTLLLFLAWMLNGMTLARHLTSAIGLFTIVTAFPLSAERSSVYAIVIGIIAMLWVHRHRITPRQWLGTGFVIALLVTAFVATGLGFFGKAFLDRYAGMRAPVEYWASRRGRGMVRGVWHLANNYPWGVGLGRIGAAAMKFADVNTERLAQDAVAYAADSYWAPMILETGLPGTMLITLIAVGIIVTAAANHRRIRDPELAWYSAALFGLHVSMFAEWNNGPVLTGNPNQAYFWITAGLLLKLPRIDRIEAASTAAATPHDQPPRPPDGEISLVRPAPPPLT